MSIREWIAEHNEEAVLFDGFDEALIGIVERCSQPALAVYDGERCIEILMDRDGMSRDAAIEFFGFNTMGTWAGEMTPVFLWRP